MTSGKVSITVRKAHQGDLDYVKTIADAHKNELGFLRRAAIEKSIDENEIFVAIDTLSEGIVGFVHYHHRKDGQTTLYNVAVDPSFRLLKIATQLMSALIDEARSRQSTRILLKCPEELPSNNFYKHYGFYLATQEDGKHRALNIWHLTL